MLAVAPLGATSPYFLITPGGAYDIGSRVRVADEYRKPMGRMAFTAVFEQEASWGEVVRAKVAGQAEVVPANEVRPPGTSQEQLNQTNKRLIDESKPVAAVVALRAAGYPVEITGQGAEVESLIEGMPAQGVLQVGDIILAVDGQPIDTTNALIERFWVIGPAVEKKSCVVQIPLKTLQGFLSVKTVEPFSSNHQQGH